MSRNAAMTNKRRRSREITLQALYAHEMAGSSADYVVDNLIEQTKDEARIKTFAIELFRACTGNRKNIEKYIIQQAHNWDFDRIATLDKLIMRMAITEFLYFPDIPPKVSIDEAIEVSKTFSTEKSGHFINGILDGVLSILKEEDLLKKTGRGLNE